MQCNINFTEKRNTLSSFVHCLGRYEIKFVLEGITNQETYIIFKPGDNFVSVQVTEKSDEHVNFSLNFVDSFNFLSTTIEKLVETLKKSNHNFKMMKRVLKCIVIAMK